MDRRVLVLPTAAVVIAGLCFWKAAQPPKPRQSVALPVPMRAAPLFELYDQGRPSLAVRLKAYVGRHPILVVFFDGDAGADADPLLLRLRDEYATIKRRGGIVLAVSPALPQDNRKVIERSGPFPFALLSDPALDVHRLWGRLDPESEEPRPGAFLINRAGLVAWSDETPKPLDDPDRTINDLLGKQ